MALKIERTGIKQTDLLIDAINLIEQSTAKRLNGICIYGTNGKVFSVMFADYNQWEKATIEDGKVIFQES